MKNAKSRGEPGTGGAGERGIDSLPPFSRSFVVFRYWMIPFGLGLIVFLLYTRTIAPDVLDSDGGEFQFAAWNFSFVHPTGYPLFLILGGMFQHALSIGNPAFRLNVFNAIIAACAVGVLYLAAYEISRDRMWSIVGAVSFAVSRTFWFNAGGPEVYAFNALFLALLILFAARWKNDPSARIFALFCLTYGLALTHHRTIALWLPAFGLYFLLASLQRLRLGVRVQVSASRFALATLGLLLPLLLYAYLPLRAPSSPYYQLPLDNNQTITLYDNSIPGFANYILGRTFAFELKWDGVSVARLLSAPQLVVTEFSVLGGILGMLGLGAIVRRRDWTLVAFAAMGVGATLFFNAIYLIGDIGDYYIPVYLFWALLITNARIPTLKFQSPSSNLQNLGSTFQSLLLNYQLPITIFFGAILLSAQLAANYQPADRSGEYPRDQWTKILSTNISQNAILVSNDRDEMMPLWYIQYVEKTRPDLLGLFPLITPDPKHANIGRLTDSVLDSGRPIYFIKPMPGIEIKYRLDASASPLVRVLGRTAERGPQRPSGASIAERVRVLGYDVERDANTLRVRIYLQVRSKLDRNYTAYTHLVAPNGTKIAQGNDHQLGGDVYPTTFWQVDEVLADTQAISLTNVSPGAYELFFGLYSQPGLSLLGDAEIGIVEVQ